MVETLKGLVQNMTFSSLSSKHDEVGVIIYCFQGDSGGPLVIRGPRCLSMHIGVTSFGRQCGLPNSPGIYTRTAHFVSWIDSIVWGATESDSESASDPDETILI